MIELIQQDFGEAKGLRVFVDVPPASEPVTVADFTDGGTNYGKIDFATDDTLIGEMITAARIMAENYTGRKFVEQSITAYWTSYSNNMWLPYPPHLSITSVTRKYKSNSVALVADSDYYVLGVYDDKLLQINNVYDKYHLEVKYKAGYPSVSEVPEGIRMAIMKIVLDLYDNRDSYVKGSYTKLPIDAIALLNNYKVLR